MFGWGVKTVTAEALGFADAYSVKGGMAAWRGKVSR
jgi:hypothetical protein